MILAVLWMTDHQRDRDLVRGNEGLDWGIDCGNEKEKTDIKDIAGSPGHFQVFETMKSHLQISLVTKGEEF